MNSEQEIESAAQAAAGAAQQDHERRRRAEAQLLQSLDEELELLGPEIEAEMELTGELPDVIDYMVPLAFEAWSYEKLSADSYRLSLTMDGRTRHSEKRVSV